MSMSSRFIGVLTAATGLGLAGGVAVAAPCTETGDARIWWSPEAPVAGQPLRLLAVTEASGDLALARVRGKKAEPLPTTRRGGPPWSFAAEIAAPAEGPQRIELRRGDKILACRTVTVLARTAARPRRKAEGVYWKSTRPWDRATEDLYAAFVETLFDAPVSETVTFRPLTPALRDPRRNFLMNHLALGEDDPRNREALPAEPDCADLPYFVRAYFAWKMGLPVGFRDCNRGSSSSAPRCKELFTNESPVEGKAGTTALKLARQFLRKLANTVHSGSARTALGDEATDLYPVGLTREALRPGTVYADPYGHVLMLVKWVPQSSSAGGQLLAVDGQPDGSVARKRFWEGTFLFSSQEKSAGPGWKAFRPLLPGGEGVALAPLDNQALGKLKAEDPSGAPPLSRAQETMSAEAFYAGMNKLINPRGLPPKMAYEETMAALVEQIETRIGSVDNGEKYMKETQGAAVPMPEGPKIFETVGPWEDYATPSRDMRLIIAMNVLAGLPAHVVRHPELFVLEGRKPEEARRELEALHDKLIKERGIEYKRSDGSPQRLTVADLLARKVGFETAYNPNDCVEIRWGAPEGSAEARTCQRRAPADQRARMDQYRNWFKTARRPPR
jgi:hypothetical protein